MKSNVYVPLVKIFNKATIYINELILPPFSLLNAKNVCKNLWFKMQFIHLQPIGIDSDSVKYWSNLLWEYILRASSRVSFSYFSKIAFNHRGEGLCVCVGGGPRGYPKITFTSLNSHYKAWSYKIKKHQKVKTYMKSVQNEPTVNRYLLILDLKPLRSQVRRKQSIRNSIGREFQSLAMRGKKPLTQTSL